MDFQQRGEHQNLTRHRTVEGLNMSLTVAVTACLSNNYILLHVTYSGVRVRKPERPIGSKHWEQRLGAISIRIKVDRRWHRSGATHPASREACCLFGAGWRPQPALPLPDHTRARPIVRGAQEMPPRTPKINRKFVYSFRFVRIILSFIH